MNAVYKACGALLLVALAAVAHAQTESVDTTLDPGTAGSESGTGGTTTTTTTTTVSTDAPL